MRNWFVRIGVLSLWLGWFGASLAEAAGPGLSSFKRRAWSTKTVTDTKITGTGTLATNRSVTATYEVITVTSRFFCFTSTYTKSTFTATYVDAGLINGDVVTFSVAGVDVGTATASGGQATLQLSSKKGNAVPVVLQNDSFGGTFPQGAFRFTNFFGAPVTTVTTSSCGW